MPTFILFESVGVFFLWVSLKLFECGRNKDCLRLCLHQKLTWIEVHIYSVKATSQAGYIRVKYIMTTQKAKAERKSARDLTNLI